MNLVFSENQIKGFMKVVYPELFPYEGVFVSMACRNKYLDQDERDFFKLTGTEMFTRQVLPSADPFLVLNWLDRYQFDDAVQEYLGLQGYTSKNGKALPIIATTCYININPTDGIWVAEKMAQWLNGKFGTAMRHGDKELHHFRKMTNQMNKLYQQSRSRKLWVDIDMDIIEDQIGVREDLIVELKNHEASGYVVETKGGFHIMIEKETLKFNYPSIVEQANAEVSGTGSEVIINKNEMIPLPGTVQAGFPVTILKEF